MAGERAASSAAFANAVEQRLDTFEDPNCEFDAGRSIKKAIRLFSHEGLLEGRIVPEAQLGYHGLDIAEPDSTGVRHGPFMRYYTAHNVYLYHLGPRKNLFVRQASREDEDALWHPSTRQNLVEPDEAERVTGFINNLQERPDPIYKPEGGDTDFWTYRCRLPQPEPRAVVLEQLAKGIHHMPHLMPNLANTKPIDGSRGLSGALLGPNDAAIVEEIIFARDPSRKFGTRQAAANDEHAASIALNYGWQELNYFADGSEEPSDAEEAVGIAPSGRVRSIMGRNLSLYDETEGAFTMDQTHGLLLPDSPLRLKECYLWAMRPGWKKHYGEPGALVEATATTYEQLQNITEHMIRLAWSLNWQDRFVQEIEHDVPLSPLPLDIETQEAAGLLRTVAFKRNVSRLPKPPRAQ